MQRKFSCAFKIFVGGIDFNDFRAFLSGIVNVSLQALPLSVIDNIGIKTISYIETPAGLLLYFTMVLRNGG